MQLGIGSYSYGWNVAHKSKLFSHTMDEHDLIGKAKEFGIKLLQVGDNLPMHEWDERRLNIFKKKLKENKIELEIGAKGLTKEHLCRYLKLCRKFDTRVLRFIIDDKEYQPSLHEINNIIESSIKLLTRNKVVLALENHDRFVSTDYASMIKQAGTKQVGICLDTVNSIGAGESIPSAVDILLPFTVNLHIKDYGISRLSHKQGFIIDGRIAGEGLLDIPSLIERIIGYNHCHTCILEQWVPPEKEIEATLKKEIEWAEKSIANLKNLPVWGNSYSE
ncbi:MAG: TIM barrel protein [Ferruginibacter sp.]